MTYNFNSMNWVYRK